MLRLKDVFNPEKFKELYGIAHQNFRAVYTLGFVFASITLLALLFIVLPMVISARRRRISFKGSGALLPYFAAIGIGFMFIEIAKIQQLIIFLGHPTYALAVVLFSLLLFTGAGSYCSAKIGFRPLSLLAIPAVLLLIMPMTDYVVTDFRSATDGVRILLSVLILAPLGFVLGFPFPLGIAIADKLNKEIIPWLWGVNGATSVFATVAATAVSFWFGIGASYWAGIAAYVMCGVFYFLLRTKADLYGQSGATIS